MSTIEIRRPDDEHVEILVDGELAAYASHDEEGWAGMQAVVNTTRGLAKALNVEVIGA